MGIAEVGVFCGLLEREREREREREILYSNRGVKEKKK